MRYVLAALTLACTSLGLYADASAITTEEVVILDEPSSTDGPEVGVESKKSSGGCGCGNGGK
ncbi:MAG: hypothetical protein ACD_17C00119G0004 [uncultured bacterium]|nr:MAG: hypothetical protein ACD_17C00119G0004 [uncultured bacterium]OGN55858.1 MAG: hypothetical protein A2796_07360 [Chlamydiae bacterium RIFCSPHIGHO2_01_FULL_44_39]OGN57310.1 MAG: hypothetical protein A3C42_03125 [Chlamydiae bacterium RIFCSPHIGHO2_02_FULL_45_9]OGN60807.1 MAG: hypothetical protein A3D96_00215 [Chlamydiae bacterium RIFCSPHIGHO2_12_FULL_44_59]OGN66683.1 MAG: hypothetical protein A2978_02850 [Chlamydiae bacterium RIFCSPLOWO2_01_FULL_44_52]OGN67333.1 MAG: hypothetical protein A3